MSAGDLRPRHRTGNLAGERVSWDSHPDVAPPQSPEHPLLEEGADSMSLQRCGVLFACLVLSLVIGPPQSLAQLPAGPGDWPQWRGPNRDGVSQEKGLLKEWPSQGPPVVWQVDTVGIGYSSLAIKDGRIFTQGDIDGVEHILALSVKDGSTLWSVQPGPAGQLLASRV